MNIYCFETNNRPVTRFYLDIIIESLKKCGYSVLSLPDNSRTSLKGVPANAWFLTTSHKDIPVLRLKGYHNFIHWFQGLPAEEDYMQTHSKLRRMGLNLFDRMTVNNCAFGFFVSHQLKEYVTRKFHVEVPNFFIMPCFNEIINKNNFFIPEKYEHNTFCYVGSTVDAWQKFEYIVEIYKYIELHYEDCLFKIITPNPEEAEKYAVKHKLKNVIIKSVAQDRVSAEICDCKFGFIIRDNNIVNNVATPTKLSNYLSNGIMPIFSDSLLAYTELAKEHPYLYVVNEDNILKVIDDFISKRYEPQLILDAYNKIFDSYFNRALYVSKIELALKYFFNNIN